MTTERPPNDPVRTLDWARMSQADRALAANCGYKPVFRREFGYLSTFSFALSVSELVSAYPTCGGIYFTVSKIAPKKYVPFISWITGWLNLLGQLAGVAASEWGAALFLLAVVSISSDFTYLPSVGHTGGVMAGLTILTGLVNSLSTYWMAKITKYYVIFHVLVLITCVIALLVMAQPENGSPKNTAAYVFTDVSSRSGWSPRGWSFLFGFLSVSWAMTDYDATAHIAEEIKNPEIKAPWAISMAMLFTYVAGWLFTIVLCFVMGDITGKESILDSPIEQPVSQIFYNVLGKPGGIAFTACAFIILKFGTFTAMQSLTRTIFAFSRDELLPLSCIWTKIMPQTGTPILAVWASVLCCIGIDLIGLSSYTAIAGVFNVCTIALDWSYCIPIFCKVVFGQFTPGPWHLGKYSLFVNAYACLWTLFLSVIFIMPTIRPVTSENMNYAIAYLAAILFFSMLYWVFRGKKHYTGPLIGINCPDPDVEISTGAGLA
uniref:Putative amino acid transporter n=1 Tax=Alternaria oxytropis TaxID=570715 RepID=A0A2Z2EZN4_9PLEO|nr:putative amino acid transporter [Alternaria oxytropis]